MLFKWNRQPSEIASIVGVGDIDLWQMHKMNVILLWRCPLIARKPVGERRDRGPLSQWPYIVTFQFADCVISSAPVSVPVLMNHTMQKSTPGGDVSLSLHKIEGIKSSCLGFLLIFTIFLLLSFFPSVCSWRIFFPQLWSIRLEFIRPGCP